MSEKVELNGTSCAKCIFATWDEDNMVQLGCKANRLSKFIERGETLVTLVCEDVKNFFIKNRICVMCSQNKQLDNSLEEMRKRITLQALAVVLVYDETVEQIEQTIISLISQTLAPKLVNIVINSDTIKTSKIIQVCRKYDFEWNVTNIKERGAEGERVSLEWCVDHIIDTCTLPYYSVFVAGFKVPPNFYQKIDEAINDELYKIVALMPIDDWNGTFVQTDIHKKMCGNYPSVLEEDEEKGNLYAYTVIDKIHYVASQQNQLHVIMKASDICLDILS